MDYGMMAADSECSSGCESGWTLYLENSYLTSCKGEKSLKEKQEETEEEEEEDLSMVSDASSGPPNFHQEEEYGHNIINGSNYYAPISNPKSNSKRQKAKDKKQKQLSVLDDTASSPIFDFSNNNFSNINKNTKSVENVLDFSQGYSATHFQGRSAYQEHYGYFQSSLLPGNKLEENQWFEEKRWG